MDDTTTTAITDTPQPSTNADKASHSPATTYKIMRQKWREYVIEILVIILGITISFALNAWKEQQTKSELEHVYLKSLYHDISADVEALQEVIDKTRQVVNNAKSLLAYSQQEDVTNLNGKQFLQELRSVFDRPNFVSNDATFTDLKSSGNMQVLTDFELKNSLFNYYKQYEAIKAVEVAERDATLFLVAPYITKRFLFSELPVNSGQNDTAIKATLKETEYINSIFVRLANREELLSVYKDIFSKSQKIKAALQKQIR